MDIFRQHVLVCLTVTESIVVMRHLPLSFLFFGTPTTPTGTHQKTYRALKQIFFSTWKKEQARMTDFYRIKKRFVFHHAALMRNNDVLGFYLEYSRRFDSLWTTFHDFDQKDSPDPMNINRDILGMIHEEIESEQDADRTRLHANIQQLNIEVQRRFLRETFPNY